MAIDFGTSFTAAAVIGAGGAVDLVEVEDERRFPSGVLLAEDGSLLVGKVALGVARRSPDRFERAPKRLVGQAAVLLGGQPVDVVELVAAVLSRVAEAARMQEGGSAPSWVRLTHPAGWGEGRRTVLVDAASRAGLGEVELLSEPEAAAWFFVEDRRGEEPVVEPGSAVAVYDLGGGTYDTAVLRRTEDGFELAGPPGGMDWFGGEDFDERLLELVINRVFDRELDIGNQLKRRESDGARRAVAKLRDAVREAKEALSTVSHTSIPVEVGDALLEIEVTRAEFERLIEADLERTISVLDKTVRDAGVAESELAAVYLTGGSSRVPLAAVLVSQYHPHTHTRLDPKTLVAQGAARAPTRKTVPAPEPAVAKTAPAPDATQPFTPPPEAALPKKERRPPRAGTVSEATPSTADSSSQKSVPADRDRVDKASDSSRKPRMITRARMALIARAVVLAGVLVLVISLSLDYQGGGTSVSDVRGGDLLRLSGLALVWLLLDLRFGSRSWWRWATIALGLLCVGAALYLPASAGGGHVGGSLGGSTGEAAVGAYVSGLGSLLVAVGAFLAVSARWRAADPAR